MVNSGSSANLVMIAALKKYYGWHDGDEIIVSCVGFPTTIAPIVQNGLKPVFVDIDFSDLNWNIDEIEDKVSTKTRGIFSSPVLGNPYNLDDILDQSRIHVWLFCNRFYSDKFLLKQEIIPYQNGWQNTILILLGWSDSSICDFR